MEFRVEGYSGTLKITKEGASKASYKYELMIDGQPALLNNGMYVYDMHNFILHLSVNVQIKFISFEQNRKNKKQSLLVSK